jgi:hypothetical protein
MMRNLMVLIALAALTACGSATRLRPQQGMTEVPRAANADRRETAPELMTPSTQAQPDRQADLLTKSAEREDDPFALPPGPNNGRTPTRPSEAAIANPPPENTAQDKNTTGQGLPDTVDAEDDTPDEPPPAPGSQR